MKTHRKKIKKLKRMISCLRKKGYVTWSARMDHEVDRIRGKFDKVCKRRMSTLVNIALKERCSLCKISQTNRWKTFGKVIDAYISI